VEPFRAARASYDLELAAAGTVPAERLQKAAEVLRRAGALPLAERLEARLGGPWRALAGYLTDQRDQLDQLDRRDPPGDFDLAALNRLLAAAGYPDAAFGWSGKTGHPPAAGEVLAAEVDAGILCLSAARSDDTLRALFALAVRDGRLAARPPREPREAGRAAAGAPATPGGAEMVGESPTFCAARERLDRLAPADIPVLILGESGTGKELAARRIHRGSPRAKAPFLAVNCAALSETLILSDLFGHGRGAFTGADRDRAGVFEAAQGGTVFLDEIGDLPLPAQGMLLRVLQEGEVRRLGESLPRRVDVRVLAATHRDLSRMIEDGTFRRDLYFRLRVGSVHLPPLRERGEDLLPLAEAVLRQKGLYARDLRVSPAAWAVLRRYDWPGNVRELENVLRLAAALAGGDLIRPEHLDLPVPAEANESTYHQRVDALRRRLVAEAMSAAAGNRTEAARRLGLSRQALSYLVRQLGLS
jgi:DNA-binding NtrC family response regulator